MSMKNSSDTIGYQTRDLLACTAVTQPSAPPRAPSLLVVVLFISLSVRRDFLHMHVVHVVTFFVHKPKYLHHHHVSAEL
jgi:hypothetical protein